MCPCAVQVTELQDQLQKMQDFKQTVADYRPQLLNLDAASAKCCTPPPTPGGRPQPTKPDETASAVAKELQRVWDRYNSLEAATTERETVLAEFLPIVQQHESSQGAWLQILENWEETVANLSPPATTPALVEQQIKQIKDLLQSIYDHEPDFTSLKKEAHTLCGGPPREPQLLASRSELRDSSAEFVGKKLDDVSTETPKGRGSSPGKPGWNAPRPGQCELEAKLGDYERRLEELRERLGRCLGERERQLERARECQGILEGVGVWLKVGVADLEELRVRDPSCAVIEEQQTKCQAMMEDVASRADEKAKLHSLVQELTSELSADNEERAALLQQLSDVNREWEELQQQLSECQEKLDSAHSHAAPYEDALERLFPWIPDTLARLEGLGACPTEPEAVEQRKNKIEAMKGEYNTLAPVCAGCLDNARSLSSLTDPGDPKTALDDHTSRLHDDWERLGALFGDVLAKLTEALVQTQEFKSIADGLEQWMTGMGGTLNQQDLIAARVNLVEGQIEGFKPILTDVAAYGETVEKTRALGSSLKEESEEEEREKIDRRLEALSLQFAELQNAADERMRGLEEALEGAREYERRCDVVDQWLGQAESRLRSRDPLSIASQPLTRQELEIREFQQEVESYGPAVEGMTQSEETLFSAALASILSCEPGVLRQAAVTRRSSTPRSVSLASPLPPPSLGERGTGYTRDEVVESSSDLPQWLQRPGATEAVVVGADIRARYAALKTEAGNKADEAAQLLQTVLGYEADCCHMKEWLGGQSSTIAGFAPPGVTVETIRAQLTEVEDLERGFTNTRERLESVNARGTTLVDGCRDELSRESGRSSLAELNESWGECLAALSEREEMLKRALELAEKYQEGYGEFDTWLSGCVEKAAEALKVDGDPSEINRQLNEQQALLEEVKGRKPALTALVSGGRALEDYVMDNRAEGVADIGYTKMEQRYNTLQASLDGRISKLEETLNRVGNTAGRLKELLAQEREWRERLENHPPLRVLPPDIERQRTEFSVMEQQYIDLQPAVSETLRQASMFAADHSLPTESTEDDLAQLHSSLSSTNEEVGQLVRNWSDRLRTRQSTANKFDQDYNGLMSWLKAKDEELLRAEAVAGVPDRVTAQITEVEELQRVVGGRRSDLTAVGATSDSLCQEVVPEDSLALGDKMAGLKAAYEALERNIVARRRVLEDGLKQAREFVEQWEAAMAVVEAKSQELQGMSAVGVDIESVKNQLEEHKEFTESVLELKPQISEVQAAGKRLKEACSAKDGPAVTQQLDQLSAAWAKLNSDTLNRKHQLEDALLQLGQFHDALAQLLSWIADSTGKVSEAPPPGVKTEAVEMQLNELKSLDSAIASHESTVTSLNEAAQKLMSSNTAENTAAETEQDIASLNEKWDHLKALAAERRSSLDTALERAQCFHDNWKRESDWLTEAERRAYADWTPRGLPETCDEEIREHEVFMGEVQSHEEGLDALRGEGEELKGQGTPDDQKRVDLWVEDLAQRLDELGGAIDDRQVQLQQAREKAGEFDNSYRSLAARLEEKEATLRAQEPIHSEVEVVKRQLEENKEFLKGVAELEGQLDTLEGLGLLLAGGCMPDDKEVILQRTSDMRAMWDGLNSAAMERQSSLEESLLSLGEFEDAYSELWAWLTDALRQLGETEPITGDPDMVAAQLARHKALQKQLGARMSSRNAVTKAAKVLMKQKTGEDRAVLKKKLQDLEREWEKVCQMSVDRQSKLEDAYRGIGQFRAHLGPLRTWMAKVLPSLDESEPVHGDMDTVLYLTDVHMAFQKELGSYQRSVDSANASGERLVAEVLDDPAVTQQDLAEMNTMWEGVCVKSVQKQERLDEAQEAARAFEEGLSELLGWIEQQREVLDNMAPPDEDAGVLQEQIEENKAFSQEVTGKQGEYERVRGEGQHLLQLAHPQAVAVLGSNLQELERAWLDLRGRGGARSEALASLLLELHGLQDMLGGLWDWVAGAEATMTGTETTPIGNDMETVEAQLAQHEGFQEEMATHQPNMDALNKIAKKRKAETPTTNPEMTKRISSLYKRWQRLWLRSSERHRQLLEARTRLNDIALARSFNFDAWRKRFNGWVDQQKLRVNDLFRRFDSNHDGMLTREEFMKGLKASGLAMSQIELEKIADHFDRDKDGYIDLSEISSILRGLRRARSLAKKQPISDSEKIDYEIQHQVSHCSCSKKFKVVRVAEGQYRFGDSQKLRLVRILRSTVMVRVGGGWEPLEEFLRKHDPCRATRRTNASLRGMGVGLTTASFATKTQTAISHKNSELRGGGGGGEGDATLTVTELPSGRKTATLPTKRSSSTTIMRPGATGTWSGRGSRESTPTRSPGLSVQATRAEPLRHTLVRQGSPKTTRTGGQARSRTPSRGLSPPTGNGHKTPTSAPTTPSHIPKPARRPISPSSSAHTATGVGPRPSGIPTPSRSKVAKNSPRHK